MSGFTAAYLARLEIVVLTAAVAQGWLAAWSWRGWSVATRGAPALVRYRLAAAHLASLLVLPGATVIGLHIAAVHLRTVGAKSGGGGPVGELVFATYDWAIGVAPALATVWAVGVGVMLTALLAQLWRLSQVDLRPADPAVRRLVDGLAQRWPGGAPAKVCAGSGRAPHVSGLFQPVLFTPADLGQRLTACEQEAVLLHELAHLRRHDFAWNLLQRLALSLVWFLPQAWGLYRAVQKQREACCDAAAVERGARPAALARALVILAEDAARPAASMGIASCGALTERVERLLAPAPAPLRRRQALAGVASLSLAGLSAMALARVAAMDPALGELSRASLFGPTISIAAHDPRGGFQLRVRRGRVIAAAVGSRRLPVGRIVQDGAHVTLLDAGERKPILSLQVSPGGSIRWRPRT